MPFIKALENIWLSDSQKNIRKGEKIMPNYEEWLKDHPEGTRDDYEEWCDLYRSAQQNEEEGWAEF